MKKKLDTFAHDISDEDMANFMKNLESNSIRLLDLIIKKANLRARNHYGRDKILISDLYEAIGQRTKRRKSSKIFE